MPEIDPNEEPQYDLVMPFVLVQSNGGPYDDDAFVAGWRLADLDAALKNAAETGVPVPTQTLYPSDEQQADLIAMHRGFRMKVTPHNDDWAFFDFEPGVTPTHARTTTRDALAAIVKHVLDVEVMYDEDDWHRIADAVLAAGFRRPEKGQTDDRD